MKKVFSFLCVLTLLVSSIPIPSAQAATYCFPKMTDVLESDWFCPAIKNLASQNIIKSDGPFNPSNKLNRAEALKIMFEASGVAPEEISNQFFDIAPDWFSKYFFTAYGYQYIQSENQKLNPGKEVTKAELIILFMKVFEIEPEVCTLPSDKKSYTIGSWVTGSTAEKEKYLCSALEYGFAEKLDEPFVERAVAIQFLSNLLKQ